MDTFSAASVLGSLFVDGETEIGAGCPILARSVLKAGPTGITAGQTIDLLIGGGTVLLADGRTISDHAYDPTGDYSLQPGHRYVFVLEYRSQGEFFRDHKDWELVNGIAIPNRRDEVARARGGYSKYSGITESAFIEAVRKAVLQQHGR